MYENADPEKMAEACRHMAGWKLAGNGQKVSKFASRGGPQGAKNPRKGFGAELADPYAAPDEQLVPHVTTALQLNGGPSAHESALKEMKSGLEESIEKGKARGVASALCYLHDPRDFWQQHDN